MFAKASCSTIKNGKKNPHKEGKSADEENLN